MPFQCSSEELVSDEEYEEFFVLHVTAMLLETTEDAKGKYSTFVWWILC